MTKPRDSMATTTSIRSCWYRRTNVSTTYRNAGPSFRSVVMSLKRIPSVGKFLMSRIFALRSATSMDRYLTPDAAVRKTPKCPQLWHGDTAAAGDVRGVTRRHSRPYGLQSRIFGGELPTKVHLAPNLLTCPRSVP